ncbi:hypothetical protein C8Q75DRAFT_746137 [Abortiporus biennis]|nr:hypothetical protein C8Q75DRAFT_746137 [Abortiporus biennis]
MQASIMQYPTTPTSHRTDYPVYLPARSSPLASSPTSTPTPNASTRRRSQYKSQQHALSTPSTSRTSKHHRHLGPPSSPGTSSGRRPSRPLVFQIDDSSDAAHEEPPRKAFLRQKFKERCLERAQKDRERKLNSKRREMMRSDDLSSDGFDASMDCEDEEDDDTILNDELFNRIMLSANRKQRSEYQRSYYHDVGSSFDPELEDINEWENDLKEEEEEEAAVEDFTELTPEELEEAELEAYAEQAALDDLDLDNIPIEDIFSLSDLDDIPGGVEDVDMD